MQRRRLRRVLWGTLISGGALAAGAAQAGEWFFKHARLHKGLPRYNYGYDDVRTSDFLTTAAAVEEQVVVTAGDVQLATLSAPESMPWRDALPTAESSILHRQDFIAKSNANDETGQVPGKFPIAEQWPVTPGSAVTRPIIMRRKTFAPDEKKAALQIQDVTLQQLGLAIYETGEIAATGSITLQLSDPPGKIGKQVLIEIRGFGATPSGLPDPPNGPMHFRLTHCVWLSSGQESTISLVGVNKDDSIRRHFDEITHLQIKLYDRQSR